MPPLAFDHLVFDHLLTQARPHRELALADRWRHLEAAHVLGQTQVVPHLRAHAAMLALAWHTRDMREVIGQLLRLALVPLGHALGRLPMGNPGRSTVSAFQPFPIRQDLLDTLRAAEAAVEARR